MSMDKDSVADVTERLKKRNISYYRIAKIIDEPESTIQNIFKGHSQYSSEKVNAILVKINDYLDELESTDLKKDLESKIKIPATDDCPEIFENFDLYIKLFELGLNAKIFNPEEKLHFAIWHGTLTAYKKNLKNNE